MTRSARALWLVLVTAVRVSPLRSLLCLVESLARAMRALNPLFFGLFTTGALQHRTSYLVWAVVGLAGSTGLNMILMLIGNVARFRQSIDVAFAFDVQVAQMNSSIATLDHMEDAELLDKLQVLRDNEGALGNALNLLLNTLNNLAFAAASIVVAVTADWRLILLALFGIPRVIAVRWSLRWDKRAEEQSGSPSRLAQSLLDLTAEASAGAETRVFGLQEELRRRTRDAVAAWRAPLVAKARRYGVLDATMGVLYFGAAVAIIGWVARDALHGSVPASALVVAVSVIGAMQQLSQTFVWGIQHFSLAIRNANRFLWLREYTERVAAEHPGTAAPPAPLRRGIRLEHLSYRYPGADSESLSDVSLDLPAGAVVALVGENGAGKSTLVKLLAGMYQPTGGRILLDGADLADVDLDVWRMHMSGAFQDHANLEFAVQQSVGVGDVARVDDRGEVMRALRDGSAADVLTALPDGLDTQLGTSWPDGVELSGGQWQRLAIARGMMRNTPLLLVLDEPTSALDAATEHALFERYAEAARKAGGRGAVTLLVTHRFSTVSAADLVVVLDRGHITEQGTHAELIAARGHYAELYELQARGYR